MSDAIGVDNQVSALCAASGEFVFPCSDVVASVNVFSPAFPLLSILLSALVRYSLRTCVFLVPACATSVLICFPSHWIPPRLVRFHLPHTGTIGAFMSALDARPPTFVATASVNLDDLSAAITTNHISPIPKMFMINQPK